jgi:hypothetical protein
MIIQYLMFRSDYLKLGTALGGFSDFGLHSMCQIETSQQRYKYGLNPNGELGIISVILILCRINFSSVLLVKILVVFESTLCETFTQS